MTNIGLWQEYISSLSDEKFFYIMRLYLGEVKTPYNKLRLIEQLASFIKNPENTKNFITLLDETDIKLLTAIKIIPTLTQGKLISFFSDEFSFPVLYSKISNLTERLLIFKTKSPNEFFRINPLLENEIEPFLNPEIILPVPVLAESSFDTPFVLSPNFLASFISYIKINGVSLKTDGNFKKSDLTALEKIYGEKINCLHLLINAFINLGLVHDGEKNLLIDEKRFNLFVELPELKQYIYLCTASGIRLGREGLKKQSQILADCLASIPEEGYTKKTFIRLAHLVSNKSFADEIDGEKKTVSRFSQMLSRARSEMEGDFSDSNEAANIVDAIFDAAVEFGLLHIRGETESGEYIYVCGFAPNSTDREENDFATSSDKFGADNKSSSPNVQSGADNKSSQSDRQFGADCHAERSRSISPKVLNINATSSVILLPGLPLKKLLPLTSFLQIVSSSTVTEFEITRQSVSKAFDAGLGLEKIKSLLSEYATFELPQNLLINLEEWHNSYSSAMLYKGYVLKVSKDNIKRTENNPNITPYIKEKLADGIYLLNIPVDADSASFVKSSGLEFLSTVKQVEREVEQFSLPEISDGRKFSITIEQSETPHRGEPIATGDATYREEKERTAPNSISSEESKRSSLNSISREQNAITLQEKFFTKLDSMELDKLQKESLQSRIENHLIVSESQLVPTSVRSEIIEVDGIDFHGKIHLVEASIKDEDMLEISLPSPDGKGGNFTLLGKPLSLIKHEGEAVMRFQIEPTMEQDSFLVSKITHIKRIRK